METSHDLEGYGSEEFVDLVNADPMMGDFDVSMDCTPDFETTTSLDSEFDILSFVLNEDDKGKVAQLSQGQLGMGNILGEIASLDVLDDIFRGVNPTPVDFNSVQLHRSDSDYDTNLGYLNELQTEHDLSAEVYTVNVGGSEARNRRKSKPGGTSTSVEEVIFEDNINNMTANDEEIPVKRGAPKSKTPRAPKAKKPKMTRTKTVIKMHTLDVNEHPEAKNAVAARRRRERDNEMKRKLRDEIDQWKVKFFAEEKSRLATEEKLRLAEATIRNFNGTVTPRQTNSLQNMHWRE